MARDTDITVRLRDRFSQGMTRLGRGVRGLRQRFFNLRSAVLGVVAAMGAFAAARGVSNFLKGAVQTAQSFEEQMSTVRAVTGATAEEFSALNTAAEEAGRSTRFTATEAGQGLENLSRAGFNAKQAIDALNPTLNLAQANAIGVGEAASLITTTLNQYGQAADQAGRVSDVLTRAAQRADTTVTDLGEAFGYVGPLAAQAGVSIEDTAAMLAAMADQGFRGSRAGTALTRMFIELQNPSSKFRKELKEIGITSTDAVEVIEQLREKGEDARDALLALGQRGGPAITALVNEGLPKMQALSGELRNAEGTAKDAAATMDDNLGGALKNLGSAFEGLQIELVSDLMDRLKEEVFDLANAIREFTKSEGFQQLKTDLAAAFDSALKSLKAFLAEFDFQEATKRLGTFVRETGQKTDEIINKIRVIGRTAKGIGASIRVAFNGLDFAISKTVETLAFAVRKVFELDNVIAEKIPGWRKHTEDLAIAQDVERRAAERAAEAKRDLGEATADLLAAMEPLPVAIEGTTTALNETGEAGGRAKQGLDQAKEGIEGVKDAASDAPETIAEMEQAMSGMSDAAGEGASAQSRMREELERQNSTLRDTGNEIQNVADQTNVWTKVAKIWKGETKDAADETANAADNIRELGEQSERTAEQVETGTESFEKAQSGAQGVGQAIADITARYKDLGGTIGDLGQQLVKEAARLPTTITAFFRNLGRELDRAEQQYERNIEHFERWRQKLEEGSATASEFVSGIKQIGGEAALLDKQRLDFFRQQLQQARQDAAALRQEIAQTTADIEAELLRAQGKEGELIERRFANRRRELELLLESTSDQAQKQKLRESLRNLDELEDIELRKIRERNEAERQANKETHRQRETDASDFHEGELDRAKERSGANAGAVANYNETEEQSRAFHEREMQRIREREQAEINATRKVREERERALGSAAAGSAGAMNFGNGQLTVVHRVLSDALNGQGITIGEEQMTQLTNRMLQQLVGSAGVSGFRRVN